MREEAGSPLPGTLVRHGDPSEAQFPPLVRQAFPQINGGRMPRSGPLPQGVPDLRSHLITITTNPNATVHYGIRFRGTKQPHCGQSAAEDSARRPAPPSMQETRHARHRVKQEDRNTIGHGHQEEDSRGCSHMPVHPLRDGPPGRPAGVVRQYLRAMHLVPGPEGSKRGERALEPVPSGHHLAHGSRTSEAQVELVAGRVRSFGHAGQDSEIVPLGDETAGD